MKGKKGQLGGLQGAVFTLILVGIVIAAGFFVIQEFYEQDQLSDTAGTVNNESGIYLNGTTYTVASATKPCFNTFVVTSVIDQLTNVTLDAGNYTTNAATGTIVNASDDANATQNHYISYTYQYGEASCTGVNQTLDAMSTIPELLPLIILIVIIGIILSVLFTTIPGARLGA